MENRDNRASIDSPSYYRNHSVLANRHASDGLAASVLPAVVRHSELRLHGVNDDSVNLLPQFLAFAKFGLRQHARERIEKCRLAGPQLQGCDTQLGVAVADFAKSGMGLVRIVETGGSASQQRVEHGDLQILVAIEHFLDVRHALEQGFKEHRRDTISHPHQPAEAFLEIGDVVGIEFVASQEFRDGVAGSFSH
jgi:hypothetical protein